MNKPISTGVHGVFDYLTAGALMTLPGVLGFSPNLTRAMQMIGLKKLVTAMLTKNEMGIVKLVPMKTHLAADAVAGVALCALPFVMDERDDDTAMAVCVGLGLNELAVASMSETQPREDSAIPDVGQRIRRTVKGSKRTGRRAVSAE